MSHQTRLNDLKYKELPTPTQRITMKVPFASSLLIASFLLPALAAAAPPVESPYNVPQPPFFGQVRTRTEYDAKAMRDTAANKSFFNTQLRTRLGFTAVPSEKIEIKVEFQDVRFMGTEPPGAAPVINPATSTVGNAKGVDLLQGYFAIEEGNFKTALGRQKMSLGAGRFLSTLEWSPTSRAFDGWSFNWKLEPGNLTGLVYLVRDSIQTAVKDHDLLSGLYYNHMITPDIGADVFAFYDKSVLAATVAGVASLNHDLQYYGERVFGKAGPVLFEEEFIWQAGELGAVTGEKTSAAFQLATRLGVAFGTHKVNAGVDMMSGDDDPADAEITTYRANYYFAHAYYGWMDYFVVNPAMGVIDYRLDGDFAFLPNESGNPRLTLKPQYHFFTPHKVPSAAGFTDDPYGQEINLEAHLALYPKSNIVFGAGVFLAGDNAYRIGGAASNAAWPLNAAPQNAKNGVFLYFMPMFNF